MVLVHQTKKNEAINYASHPRIHGTFRTRSWPFLTSTRISSLKLPADLVYLIAPRTHPSRGNVLAYLISKQDLLAGPSRYLPSPRPTTIGSSLERRSTFCVILLVGGFGPAGEIRTSEYFRHVAEQRDLGSPTMCMRLPMLSRRRRSAVFGTRANRAVALVSTCGQRSGFVYPRSTICCNAILWIHYQYNWAS